MKIIKTKKLEYRLPLDWHKDNSSKLQRPSKLKDFIGHEDLKEQITIRIAAAKKHNRPFPHVLFTGGPGLGKTTLGNIIANEMGVRFYASTAGNYPTPISLADHLIPQKMHGILFLDEIHQLKKEVEEALFYAMEDWKISFISELVYKPVTEPIFPWTLIGATTDPQKLTQPLKDRFKLHIHIRPYNLDELSKIAKSMANHHGMKLTNEAALLVAKAGRSTPRIISRLIDTIVDYVSIKEIKGLVTQTSVDDCFRVFNIHPLGLEFLDISYLGVLESLYKERGAGLKTIATSLGESMDTLSHSVEPFLIHNGYIMLTGRGRKITDKGSELIKSLKGEF